MAGSAYFTDEELTHSATAQARGVANEPSPEAWGKLRALVRHILDPARKAFGKPIRINSGYRSERVNRLVGGARGSQHTLGEAADITSSDNPGLLAVLRTLPYDQLIAYTNRRGAIQWIHVSYREGRNRRQELKKVI